MLGDPGAPAGRIVRPVARAAGLAVEASDSGYLLSWDGSRLARIRVAVVLAVMALYALLYAVELGTFPLWGPYSTYDEQLQYYQAGRNFARYGFTTTALLPDLSTGTRAGEHPYVYNHQPPGPQLVIGALFRLLGEQYRVIRVLFALVFAAGLACYVLTIRALWDRGIPGAELGLLLIRPDAIMHAIDHPAYSAVPLCAFFPIVAVIRYRETERARWLAAAAAVAFGASNYLIYGPLFMICALWGVGWLLGVLPIRGRELLLLLGMVAAGIALHLLQTVVLLGWPLFWRELVAVLGNRMFGVPTRQQLVEFYRTIGLVHYGGHVFSIRRLWEVLTGSWWFPAREAWELLVSVLLAVSLGLGVQWRGAGQPAFVERSVARWVLDLAALVAWIAVSIATPLVMFPAFSGDYGLNGANGFLLALFVMLCFGITWRLLARLPAPVPVRQMLVFALVGTLAWTCVVHVQRVGRVAVEVAGWRARLGLETGLGEVASRLRGQVVMTNVDPTMVGFFTRAAAFGGCHRPSLLGGGVDPSRCFVQFIRGYPDAGRPAPTAFVQVGDSQTFCAVPADCVTTADLAGQYARLFVSERVAAFDLTRPLSPPR